MSYQLNASTRALLVSLGIGSEHFDNEQTMAKILKTLNAMPQTQQAMADQAALDARLIEAVSHRDVAQTEALLAQGASPGDEFNGAFELAARLGEPALARALVKSAFLAGRPIDLYNTLSQEPEAGNWSLLRALCEYLDQDQLYRAAYHAQRGGAGAAEYRFLLEAAEERSLDQWRERAQSGLLALWDRRVKGQYETACDQLGVPAWSKACAESIGDRAAQASVRLDGPGADREPESGVEARRHRDHALSLPSETLLMDRAFFTFWAQELQSPGLAEDLADLNLFRSEWSATASAFPKLVSLWESAREEPANAPLFAAAIRNANAQRFAPFIMAWGAHSAFTALHAKAMPEAIEACLIDRLNIGALCANIDYGSFNARMAAVAVACRQAGRMDDDATLIARARLCDLSASPALWAQITEPPFGAELRGAQEYFEAQALAIELTRSLPPGSAAPRPRV